jgi:hypothetical protein
MCRAVAIVAMMLAAPACAATPRTRLPASATISYDVIGCTDQLGNTKTAPSDPSCAEHRPVAAISFTNSRSIVETVTVVLPWRSPPQLMSLRQRASMAVQLQGGDTRWVTCQLVANGRTRIGESANHACKSGATVRDLLTPARPEN